MHRLFKSSHSLRITRYFLVFNTEHISKCGLCCGLMHAAEITTEIVRVRFNVKKTIFFSFCFQMKVPLLKATLKT